MYDSELDELRKMAPKGFYTLPRGEEERVQVVVVGDVRKSITKDWFAIFPNSLSRFKFEHTLLKIVEQRLWMEG